MSEILVLGCGLMGPVVARDCADSGEVSRVVGCDIDEKKLEKCSEFVASHKFEAVRLDITDHKAVVEGLREVNVAVNASSARFSQDVLRAAMEAGTDLVDLAGGGYPARE